MIHGVNAAGLSAFDHVERKMAPLLHDTAGMIFPHDSFENHLDVNGKIIDKDLGKRNFSKAAQVLSEVWSNTVIDKHPVGCTAVALDQEFTPLTIDPKWVSRHVLQARYFLQVLKCDDTRWCKPFVTDWPVVFPERFMPPPVVH